MLIYCTSFLSDVIQPRGADAVPRHPLTTQAAQDQAVRTHYKLPFDDSYTQPVPQGVDQEFLLTVGSPQQASGCCFITCQERQAGSFSPCSWGVWIALCRAWARIIKINKRQMINAVLQQNTDLFN